jgi:hypothetical protein
MNDRLAILGRGLAKSDKIIEVGPAYNPIAPKSAGWMAYSIDHLDRPGLVEKYRDLGIDVAMIEAVDFIWTDGQLSEAVPTLHHGTFDVFVASHVIEHAPDLIRFLKSAEVLTRPNGRAVLAIPDKRVCFDFFRPLATTGDVLVAYREGRTRHSQKTLWDYSAYQVKKDGSLAWGRADQTPPIFTHTLASAVEFARKCDSSEYIDAHSWTFVPSSFALIMLELAALGLTDWEIDGVEAAENIEFYVWLRRGARSRVDEAKLAIDRMILLNAIVLELEDQSRQLPSSRLIHREAELAKARDMIVRMRSTRAWRARSAWRRILRLGPTCADEEATC